ncbi:MAG: hypothetical protein JXR37_26850 [Kiritimatiellae bacterium]|nr:hypothetical protein [Kiritimatiellia bacterium]
MDIQWSGAIDFEPLFMQMGKPAKQGLHQAERSPYRDKILEDQQKMMDLLNKANDPFYDATGIGRNVNIIA